MHMLVPQLFAPGNMTLCRCENVTICYLAFLASLYFEEKILDIGCATGEYIRKTHIQQDLFSNSALILGCLGESYSLSKENIHGNIPLVYYRMINYVHSNIRSKIIYTGF